MVYKYSYDSNANPLKFWNPLNSKDSNTMKSIFKNNELKCWNPVNYKAWSDSKDYQHLRNLRILGTLKISMVPKDSNKIQWSVWNHLNSNNYNDSQKKNGILGLPRIPKIPTIHNIPKILQIARIPHTPKIPSKNN